MIGPGGAAGAAVGRGRFGAKVDIAGGGGGDPDYPNRPAGMTTQTQWDGSHTTPPAGDGWTSWTGLNCSIVEDATSPGPTGDVMRFEWTEGTSTAGVVTLNEYTDGNMEEVYIMLRVKAESGYDPNVGGKFFFTGTSINPDSRNNVDNPTQNYLTWESNDACKFTDQNAGGGNIISEGGVFSDDLWQDVELHLIAESSAGAADGTVTLWVNDTLIASNTAAKLTEASDPSPLLTGFEWYFTRGATFANDSFWRVAELLIAGKVPA